MALQRREEIILIESLHLLSGEDRGGRGGDERVEVPV